MIRDLTLTLVAGSEADELLLALAFKGEAASLRITSADGATSLYAAECECVVMSAHTQLDGAGSSMERVYKLKTMKRG